MNNPTSGTPPEKPHLDDVINDWRRRIKNGVKLAEISKEYQNPDGTNEIYPAYMTKLLNGTKPGARKRQAINLAPDREFLPTIRVYEEDKIILLKLRKAGENWPELMNRLIQHFYSKEAQ